MAAFDELKRASFSNIKFPVRSVRVKGGLREHVHEYPHSPGGAPEKLGRKLYEIQMQGFFLQNLVNPQWLNLWPASLRQLRLLWEAQETRELHIPTIGTIMAYAVDWEQDMEASVRSGEVVNITFREDQSSAFLLESLVTVSGSTLVSKVKDFELATQDLNPKPSIFDAIQNAANFALSFGDQFELAGNLVEAKILGLVALIKAADSQLDLLDDPANHKILDALHELWLAAQELHEDVQSKGAKLRNFETRARMTVADVSVAVFGDSSRASEILQLNALEDPFNIPPGTSLRYYEVA